MAAENINIPGEKTILTSDNGVLTLSNYRVKYDAAANGSSKLMSITLDAVSSCGLVTQNKPIFLIFAGIAVVGGLLQHDRSALFGLLFVALCFVAAYYMTRSGVITISSNGGEHIDVPTKGMKLESIRAFVEAVVTAKLSFIGKLGDK